VVARPEGTRQRVTAYGREVDAIGIVSRSAEKNAWGPF